LIALPNTNSFGTAKTQRAQSPSLRITQNENLCGFIASLRLCVFNVIEASHCLEETLDSGIVALIS
jgi:hypothetical protein